MFTTNTSDNQEKENDYTTTINHLTKDLNIEKHNTQSLKLQIKTLEDTLKTVISEYKIMKVKFDKMGEEEQMLENQHNGNILFNVKN